MAERPDDDSKTEQPTEKRLRDAVEKGNVPFSREAAVLASLLAILFVMSFLLADRVPKLTLVLRRLLDDAAGFRLENRGDAMALLDAIAIEAARLVVPGVIVLMAAGVLASVLQNAPTFVLDRIRPELSRVSLARGWRRLFGRQGHAEFLKSLFKFGVLTLLAGVLLRVGYYDVLGSMFVDPTALPGLVLVIAAKLVSMVIIATLVLVAADVVWSRLFWHFELRMTRQEIKDELSQSDGDPLVKARLRSLARHRLRKRMMAAVPRATMVIANPTHYAVALRYVREEGGAPLVVAKGLDLIALKIRAIALAHGIPIVEDKTLARSLYAAVEVDRMIPPEFYKAVAEIALFLFARKAGASVDR